MIFWEAVCDAFFDCVRLLPFLFITYLCMELLEARGQEKIQKKISSAKKSGPVWGAVLGIIPQCGFSASAASLYAGRVISAGTLIAVFLSTSDEMVPVFVSQAAPLGLMGAILLSKAVIAVISGYFIGFILQKTEKKHFDHIDIHTVCEHEHCSCNDGILKSSLLHTIKIVGYIFAFSCIFNCVVAYIGEDALNSLFSYSPVLSVFIAALVGLIPNCFSSVMITQLYLQGLITLGALLAGLLSAAGVGMLILFKLCSDKKECFKLLICLYGAGVFWGVVFDLLKISL